MFSDGSVSLLNGDEVNIDPNKLSSRIGGSTCIVRFQDGF